MKPPASARGSFRWLAAPPAPVAAESPVVVPAPPPPAPPVELAVTLLLPPQPLEEPPVEPAAPVPEPSPPASVSTAVIAERPAPAKPALSVFESALAAPGVELRGIPDHSPAIVSPVFQASFKDSTAEIPVEPALAAEVLKDKPLPADESKQPASPGSLLEREWKLANDRSNWSLSAQAMLLVAFCVVLTHDGDRTGIYRALLYVIPLVALAINIAGLTGLIAVQVIIQKLKLERGAERETPDRPPNAESAAVSPESRIEHARKISFVTSLAITAILAGIWLWFLGSVPH